MKSLAVAAFCLVLCSSFVVAESVQLSVQGFGRSDDEGGSVSGDGVSITLDSIDGWGIQAVFTCTSLPCSPGPVSWGTLPNWFGPPTQHSVGCVFGSCSWWVAGGATLFIDPIPAGAFFPSTGTGTIVGAVVGSPLPKPFICCNDQDPGGSFIVSFSGPVTYTFSGTRLPNGGFADFGLSFATTAPISGNAVVLPEPTSLLLLVTGILGIRWKAAR